MAQQPIWIKVHEELNIFKNLLVPPLNEFRESYDEYCFYCQIYCDYCTNEKKLVGSVKYSDKTYYFCSCENHEQIVKKCYDDMLKNPEQYIEKLNSETKERKMMEDIFEYFRYPDEHNISVDITSTINSMLDELYTHRKTINKIENNN